MLAMTSPVLDCELAIPADISMLGAAREWAANTAESFGMDESACFQIKLAMSEAVTNAIMHGSASTADEVSIEAREHEDFLVFEVSDRATKHDGLPFDRLAEGGRGLAVVALVMDQVQLTRAEHGSTLRFAKRR